MTSRDWLIIAIDILVVCISVSVLVIVATYKKNLSWKSVIVLISSALVIIALSSLVIRNVLQKSTWGQNLNLETEECEQSIHLLENPEFSEERSATIEWAH